MVLTEVEFYLIILTLDCKTLPHKILKLENLNNVWTRIVKLTSRTIFFITKQIQTISSNKIRLCVWTTCDFQYVGFVYLQRMHHFKPNPRTLVYIHIWAHYKCRIVSWIKPLAKEIWLLFQGSTITAPTRVWGGGVVGG